MPAKTETESKGGVTLDVAEDSSEKKYTEEVYLSRKDDTTYTSILPSNLAVKTENGIVGPQGTLTWKGEFEPGQSDSSAFDTSVGGAVSVQAASLDSKALVNKRADMKLDGFPRKLPVP